MAPRRRLPRSLFNAVRDCARKCLIDANGDQTIATELVYQRMGSVVGSVFLTLAIQLAIKLIIWWIENRVTEPSVVCQFGEPGTSDEELDDDWWDES